MIPVLPLSAAQLGIWFAQQIDPLNPAYNVGEYVEIRGSLDPILFEQALRQVVAETEALRVQIIEHAEGPRQVVGSSPAWPMSIIDVSAEIDGRAAAESWMKADLALPIELTLGPLFGYALLKAAPDRFFWYARYHHIVMDAYGMSLVAQRVASVYTKLANGRTGHDRLFGRLSSLVDEDTAYRSSEQFTRDRQFWSEYLVDRPEVASLGRIRAARSDGFLRRSAYLKTTDLDRLNAAARRMGTGVARLIAATTAIFLHRMTGVEDLVLALPIGARTSVSQRIPGMAANVLPLRLMVCPSMSVAEVVSRAARQIRQVLDHQRFQTADMRRELGRV